MASIPGDKPGGWLDFWCNNFHPGGKVTATSEKHHQFLVLVSSTVIFRQPLHRVREAFGIFCWSGEGGVGTLASCSPSPLWLGPAMEDEVENVAA
ncbi:hypothetical protein CgunFtcFv8_005232 [Champsocephalus gunnari]|uniref:Uncharacterized protein n=1 Tax=Champsocephalus gunnari TaxID=52237 RepID=A0AAN8CXU6_CHAGU|nr:hypothetical protein CgunFtcFv8_005232 [Champsocephalus gunnari]